LFDNELDCLGFPFRNVSSLLNMVNCRGLLLLFPVVEVTECFRQHLSRSLLFSVPYNTDEISTEGAIFGLHIVSFGHELVVS